MTIIDKLNQTLTASILGENDSVAHLSLLEQFYAILIARLAQPAVYSQWLRHDHLEASDTKQRLFKQLWQHHQRRLMIDELAMTHHIDISTTEQLVKKAANAAYQELRVLAEGQFLPAFLQAQQISIRQYLPVWADEVIVPITPIDASSKASEGFDKLLIEEEPLISTATIVPSPIMDTPAAEFTESYDSSDVNHAIHASPLEYHDGATAKSQFNTSARYAHRSKNNPLIWGGIAVTIIVAASLAWALVTKPEPEATAVSIPAASKEMLINEPASPVESSSAASNLPQLKPVELKVSVDNQGALYNCAASVGGIELQMALKEALMASFGSQANACELLIQEDTADQLSNIDMTMLPNIFTLLRSVPFARLQLQSNTLTVEAPDEALLQLLLTDLSVLVPTISITSVAPLTLPPSPLPESNTKAEVNSIDVEDEAVTQRFDPDLNDDLLIGNSVFSESSNPNINDGFDNNFYADLSTSEVDDLASSTIVAEKLRNELPIN